MRCRLDALMRPAAQQPSSLAGPRLTGPPVASTTRPPPLLGGYGVSPPPGLQGTPASAAQQGYGQRTTAPPNGSRKPIRCFNCNRLGHVVRECNYPTAPRSWQIGYGSNPVNVRGLKVGHGTKTPVYLRMTVGGSFGTPYLTAARIEISFRTKLLPDMISTRPVRRVWQLTVRPSKSWAGPNFRFALARWKCKSAA